MSDKKEVKKTETPAKKEAVKKVVKKRKSPMVMMSIMMPMMYENKTPIKGRQLASCLLELNNKCKNDFESKIFESNVKTNEGSIEKVNYNDIKMIQVITKKKFVDDIEDVLKDMKKKLELPKIDYMVLDIDLETV